VSPCNKDYTFLVCGSAEVTYGMRIVPTIPLCLCGASLLLFVSKLLYIFFYKFYYSHNLVLVAEAAYHVAFLRNIKKHNSIFFPGS
jgi:hypothetical protein